MKRFLFFIFLFFSIGAEAQVEKVIPARPNPPKLVNDFANILTPEQEQSLEFKLDTFDRRTSSQIAIVTVTDLQGYEAVDYAVALGRAWGVGGQKFNNGVIVLVSTGGGEGNRDAFIATGYGLEGAIPDLTAKAITDNDLIPNLKNGDYYRAFDAATDDLIKASAGEYTAPKGRGNKGRGLPIGAIFFIIIILLSLFGGGRGRKGGGMISRRGYGDFWTGWIIGSMLGGSGRSSGSGWGGGGGGFGGFGGGSFGGGGAGGKW